MNSEEKANKARELLEERLSDKYGTSVKIIKLEMSDDAVFERCEFAGPVMLESHYYNYEVVLKLDNMDECITLSEKEAARIYGWFEKLCKEVGTHG